MKDNLLVVVDYQVDFVNGSLGFPLALELEEKIANLIAKKENEGYEVVFTKDEHDDDYLDTEEGKNLPIPHCIKGSGGEEFFGKIKKIASTHKVFIKHTFGSLDLANYIASKNYKNIELCGIDTSICVFSNAILSKASSPNSRVSLLSSYCMSGNETSSKIAYEALSRVQIFKI